jgi:VWFA-related protein
MRTRAILIYLCLASLAAGVVFAEPAAQIRSEVSVVNVFVTVRDRQKAIVPGLKQDDFQLYEDGQPQEISYFSAEANLPITLGLLMDTSGSEQFLLGAEKDAGSRFLARLLKKGDLAMVMSFDVDVDLLADFSDDRAMLNRAINRAQINVDSAGPIAQGPLPTSDSGGTNFYDAVYLACREKLSGEAGRKAIVVLTDAEDTGSRVKLQDAVEAAQRSDTVVDILLVAADGGDEGVARRLAEETGGRVIIVRSERSLEKGFDTLIEELRNQYTLGYTPANKKRDGTYRRIRVEMRNKDYSTLARRGYYAPLN